MDGVYIGIFIGMFGAIIAICVIAALVTKNDGEEEKKDDPESLVAELRAMKIITGLSRREKDILTSAADYINKGIKNDRN